MTARMVHDADGGEVELRDGDMLAYRLSASDARDLADDILLALAHADAKQRITDRVAKELAARERGG